uniref:Glycosyltransferase 2-like domain-containing protein n=1 Tax=Sander lucioperca TaxID=283035 RepID=A0A8D0AL02_SANLU
MADEEDAVAIICSLFLTEKKRYQKKRTTSVLSRLLIALPNSPLQYPIQGFTVRPLTTTPIPGLLHLNCKMLGWFGWCVTSKPLLSCPFLYLASFQFENHEAVFPITIKQPQLPVLHDMGTGRNINSHVTIATKTFLRYPQLKLLLSSIRRFYSNIEVIIADDSFEPEHITGEHIRQYLMPPAQGWFAGRNLAVSQVTTKYFLWVDDDFLFTENTKIEKLVEVMEAVPELDVVRMRMIGNGRWLLVQEVSREVPITSGYPRCFLASGVVNFFLARTDAVQRVGFDPKLQRVAHSEFFMDGLGSLLVATCDHVSIDHQPKTGNDKDKAHYARFRNPGNSDVEFKLQLHFFKNHLKCESGNYMF